MCSCIYTIPKVATEAAVTDHKASECEVSLSVATLFHAQYGT
jgi:hypothetical protein